MELNANDKDSKQIITLTCINDNSKFNIQTDLNITFNDLYDKIKDNINITYNFSIDSSKDNIEIFTNSFGKIEPSSIVNELDLLVRFSDNLFYTIKEQYDKNLTSVINYECQDLEFTGIIVFKGFTQYCGFEYSKEEIVDMMIKEYPDQLSKKWDKEKKDWIDEDSEEFFDENVYCYIGDNIKYPYIEKLNFL